LTFVLSIATAVSRIDNLEFLADVIPKTTTYKQFKEKRAKEAAREAAMEKGQTALNGNNAAENGTSRSPIGPSLLDVAANGNEGTLDQTAVTHASGGRSTMTVDPTSEDTEMED
jgi:DNA-directed RNA polymerase I subunit RPA43